MLEIGIALAIAIALILIRSIESHNNFEYFEDEKDNDCTFEFTGFEDTPFRKIYKWKSASNVKQYIMMLNTKNALNATLAKLKIMLLSGR